MSSWSASWPWWPLLVFPLAKFAIHLATYRGYGWFRDEFYYLACARRLDWGYVDHPPLAPLLLRAITELGGVALWSVRLLPALAGAGTVLLVGLIARQLGGGRAAQILAMTCAIAAPIYLALDHIFSMNAFEPLLWALAVWIALRLHHAHELGTHRGSLGLWVALGIVFGFGLQNKLSMLWLAGGLGVGLLLTPLRRWLATPGPWVAAVVALGIFLPHVLWQMAHGWPTLEFMKRAAAFKMLTTSPLELLAEQFTIMNPASAIVWAGGLVWLFASRDGRPYRFLGWAYVTILIVLAVNGTSRAHYLAPAYVWLFPAGAVAIERLATQLGRAWLVPAMSVVVALTGLLLAPLVLPILPVEGYIAYARALGEAPSTDERHELGALPQFYADMHGWNRIVSAAAGAWATIPPDEQAFTGVFAQNYGEAGALELLAPAPMRTAVISGHNNYWLWGPPRTDLRHVVVIGGDREDLDELCTRVEVAATTDCGYCMPYENRQPVYVCTGIKRPLGELWPDLKHYD